MVERAHGPDRTPEGEGWIGELGHGRFNVAYRVRLRDGYEAVVKIAPPPGAEVMTYERGAMATESAALDLIRKHTAVPVPRVDFADRAQDLCDADWFCMPFIDGDNLSVAGPALPAADRAPAKSGPARRTGSSTPFAVRPSARWPGRGTAPSRARKCRSSAASGAGSRRTATGSGRSRRWVWSRSRAMSTARRPSRVCRVRRPPWAISRETTANSAPCRAAWCSAVKPLRLPGRGRSTTPGARPAPRTRRSSPRPGPGRRSGPVPPDRGRRRSRGP
ncbi:phosphotransferase [Streptomyces antibioticus]|uniref:phosphotransferase family protein n=1 Tax=Streptomyces antibioticus TaxID=1890 RepID=UPI0036C66733